MATFMGGVQSNRGEATRLGSKESGIDCWVKSWQTQCSLSMRKDKEERDLIDLNVSDISGNKNVERLSINCWGFEDKLIINGVEFKKLLEAYKIVNFPKNLEYSK